MSLISEIGRKTPKNRIFMALIYLVLSLMGMTMIIPFLITLTGSTSNDFDYDRFSPIPKYLWSQQDRYIKDMVPYFNAFRQWNNQFQAYAPEKPFHWSNWSLIGRDKKGVEQFSSTYLARRNPAQAADYAEFMENYPLDDCNVYASQTRTIKFLMNHYSDRYMEQHPDANLSSAQLQKKALELLGREWGIPFHSFYSISFSTEMLLPIDFQGYFPDVNNPKYQAYRQFKEFTSSFYFTPGIRQKWNQYLNRKGYAGEEHFPVTRKSPDDIRRLWLEFRKQYAPATTVIPLALRASWYRFFSSEEVGSMFDGKKLTVADYNKMAGTDFKSIQETPFPIPAEYPESIRKLYVKFQQDRFPLRLVEINVTPELSEQFRKFIQKNVPRLETLNKLLKTQYKDWSEIQLTALPVTGSSPEDVNMRNLWKSFAKQAPLAVKQFTCSEIAFQKFLLKKYGSLAKVNQRYGTQYKNIEEAFPPFMAAYTETFLNNEYFLSFGPILDNYKIVIDYMLFNGNAIWVTLLLIVLTLAFTITVNPLAAYALSRFNLRGRDQILIFLLATMAFPAMVSAIPAYLLMRDLGMLNTYAALIIPGAANGMAIFILKGFFDSLPMELFEAATIDGASEMQIFANVAMPLVKPILAINCLNAFIAAYNGWAWALIICQDRDMWTLAVWLYQASIWWSGSPWIVSAGFVLTSIPTCIVFISCQKIILRGIIIPSMK